MKISLKFLVFIVMRNFIFLFAVIASLSSCSPYYYQICKVSSDLPTSENGAYYYSTSSCDITYNFWSEYGDIYFTITNKTNKVIYIDLTKSFFSKNGIAYDYFLNRTIGSSTSLSESSVNSITSQKSSSVSYKEKPIIAIPPHSTKIFCEYIIMKSPYKDCDLTEIPQKGKNVIMSFSEKNTPIEFTNYICYRIEDEEKEQFVENRFYLSQVINQHYNDTFHKVDTGCENNLYKIKNVVFIHTSPKEFYIEYKPLLNKSTSPSDKKSQYTKSVQTRK